MIPKKLWHIWIGPNSTPTQWTETWKKHHSTWEYELFDQEKFLSTKFFNQHLIDEYYKRKKYNGVADLIRYELLLKHGGFIPPVDAECFHNTEELWTEPDDFCYTVYEQEKIRPGFVSPIYACNPNNKFLEIIVNTLHQLKAEELSDQPWQSTGNGFLKEMIEKHQPKIKIFPSHYFIPEHFLIPKERYTGNEKIYADQKWYSTKKDWMNIDLLKSNVQPAKICVYAIALNEIKFVDKFMDHCQGADLVLVCDTGSTDGTAEKLRERGAIVYNITQKPWRFDVPRNTALSLIPEDIDICLSIDLDEFLQPGWTDALQQAWQQHQGQIDRICYDYIWNWNADGSPGVRFFADKVHHRKNYLWRHPCHETLYYRGTGNERRITVEGIKLHHHADNTKSRGQYLGLLKTAVKEDPENDRMAHYYARELMFAAKWSEAVEEFQRHLELPRATWREERCTSMRYIARCFKKLGNVEQATSWALRATQESPGIREPWLDLARIANSVRDWDTCYWAIKKCLGITQRGKTYMSDSACWGSEPYDIGALAAYYGGLYHQAVELGQQALNFDPNNQRLKVNLKFYLDKTTK